MEIFEMKNIKIVGYTTDYQKCDCCGKDGLKGTIAILDLRYNNVMHFGTTCASKANKYDSLEAATKAKKEIESALREFEKNLKNKKQQEINTLIVRVVDEYKKTAEYEKERHLDEITEFQLENHIVESIEERHRTMSERFNCRKKLYDIASELGLPISLRFRLIPLL